MEVVVARYLDGELTDGEAERLLRAADEDSQLERDLRGYEAVLAAAEQLPRLEPPEGFADRVMARVEGLTRSGTTAPSRRSNWSWIAAAATLFLAMAVGYWGGRREGAPVPLPFAGATSAGLVLPAGMENNDPGVRLLRAVRLVYAGSGPGVRSVAVAGSFNGWDPQSATMVREGNVWSILLILPPGEHEYMLIEDGERWVTDPLAPQIREDGFGGANGLLQVSL